MEDAPRRIHPDGLLYGGYFPMGFELSRTFAEMDAVPFKDEVWGKFLYDNAAKLLKLPARGYGRRRAPGLEVAQRLPDRVIQRA